MALHRIYVDLLQFVAFPSVFLPSTLTIFQGLQMIWAKASDIIGRKYTIITSLLIFTLFSALCGAAQTLTQLIMFRWCQGIGGCGVFALVQLLFMEIVPRRKLPAYMAMVNVALALSLVCGPLLGGGITLHGSWRWIFLLK
jgi:MFS family permease